MGVVAFVVWVTVTSRRFDRGFRLGPEEREAEAKLQLAKRALEHARIGVDVAHNRDRLAAQRERGFPDFTTREPHLAPSSQSEPDLGLWFNLKLLVGFSLCTALSIGLDLLIHGPALLAGLFTLVFLVLLGWIWVKLEMRRAARRGDNG